jgi:tight adherence protein C
MAELFEQIAQQLSDVSQTILGDTVLLPLILAFVAILLLVFGVISVFGARNSLEHRLAGGVADMSKEQAALTLRQLERETPWIRILKEIDKRFTPSNESAKAIVKKRLVQAGYIDKTALRNYYALRIVFAAGFPLAFLLAVSLSPHEMSVQKLMVVALAFGVTGVLLPPAWVSRRISERQLAVSESFPDALDMLVVCVEAGLALDAAFGRVGTQIARAHPILASHFGMMSLELRAGKSREEALRNFAVRIGLEEINSFVTLLIQSDALGTSIARTLRVHASEMRIKRMLRAEEKAHMLPVKLSIPLVTCILPGLLTALLLPGIIGIVRILIPAMTGT